MTQNNYYCSQKFWWLTVDPERRLLASCCKADQQPIDTAWLKDNPGQLFNNPVIQQERQDMLNNRPVASCSRACWVPESQGIPSRRTIHAAASARQYTDINASPEVIEIILGSSCNMDCSYCTKRYSTTWLRDIATNGTYLSDYAGDDRFNITIDDRAILKAGQKAVNASPRYQHILQEITKLHKPRVLKIMGGEPFLYNELPDIVKLMEPAQLEITTGLGVNPNRFERIVSQLPPETTMLALSAENAGALYEFNRHGNSFNNFLTNIETINRYHIRYRFANTLGNLTIHGFKQFQDEFGTPDDHFNVLIDPVYLQMNVLDERSRDQVLATDYKYHKDEIHQAVVAEYSPKQLHDFKRFAVEFARRRNLTLDVFPEHFKQWILE